MQRYRYLCLFFSSNDPSEKLKNSVLYRGGHGGSRETAQKEAWKELHISIEVYL